jgi:hypothetical protein
MTDQCCLTFAIARRSTLIAGPSIEAIVRVICAYMVVLCSALTHVLLVSAAQPFNRHGRIYPSNLIVSSVYSKYVFYIYRGVKDMEKFDV